MKNTKYKTPKGELFFQFVLVISVFVFAGSFFVGLGIGKITGEYSGSISISIGIGLIAVAKIFSAFFLEGEYLSSMDYWKNKEEEPKTVSKDRIETQ